MSEQIAVIPVFIASPSGLDDERKATYRIVQEINKSHARHWRCQFELVGWEETLPGHGRPQTLINRDLDRCEYFIGLIFDHWGSTTSQDGPYTSGFEEEFFRARSHIASGKMRDMVVFFREIPAARLKDPGDSLKKVIAFRHKCFEERVALFKEFGDTAQYEAFVRAKLEEIGWAESQRLSELSDPSPTDEQPEPIDWKKRKKEQPTSGLLQTQSRQFLTSVLSRSSGWDETSASEVARVRLIASSLHRRGNDEVSVGNHDANILFEGRHSTHWSEQELRALFACGIAGFSQQNVPIWHWLQRYEALRPDHGYLDILAAIGNDQERPNAIRLLQLLGRRIPNIGGLLDQQGVIRNWLSDKTQAPSFNAAIEFLSTNADATFLPVLEELANTSPARSTPIKQAIVAIEASVGGAKALRRLADLNLTEIGEDLTERIFSNPQSLHTDCLQACLHAGPSIIRRKALELLNSRTATKLEDAESLLSDSDHGVRLLAAEALKHLGRELSDDIAKKTLTVVKADTGRGFFGIFGGGTDQTHYEKYKTNRLGELSFEALKERVASRGVFVSDELSMLFNNYASKLQNEIRSNLKDGFEAFFELRMQTLERVYGAESEDVSATRRLLGFLRKRAISGALEALCSLRKREDLALVRRLIDEFGVDGTPAILSFLGKFGDWSDRDRVKRLDDVPQSGLNLLSIAISKFANERAEALISIAENRMADLLAEDLSFDIRKRVLLLLPGKSVAALSDEIILSELSRDADACRKILALKCCAHLTKSRVATLLDQYTARDGQRYYNTVHWLDLSASMPARVAKQVADKELERYRQQ